MGTEPSTQITNDVPKLNEGVTVGVTVTVKLVGNAHCAAAGVKVYTPEAWLLTVVGLHVPLILLEETVGNAGAVVPEQIVREVPKLKVGVSFGFTVTVNIVVVAQRPASGVNVYVPEAILSTVEGLQLPVIPLADVVDKSGTVPPAHIVNEVPKPNVGAMFGLTVTAKDAVVAHPPAVGVKV